MYIVVSKWEALPGKEAEFEEQARSVRQKIREQPGVEMIEGFKSDGHFVAVHAYRDEATYHKIVDSPDGPFQRAVNEHNLENVGRWISSERGESVN